MAEAIAPLIDDATLVVASSDLTHYGKAFGYTPFRRDLAANLDKLDKGFIEPVLGLDFDRYFAYREKTGHHGLRLRPHRRHDPPVREKGLPGQAGRLLQIGRPDRRLHSTSVSYASMLFTAKASATHAPTGLARSEKQCCWSWPAPVLRDHFQGKPAAAGLEERFSTAPRLRQKSGVFVTLRKQRELRGCIGSIVGVEPLCRGVAANALHAAFDDPRFPPLGESGTRRRGDRDLGHDAAAAGRETTAPSAWEPTAWSSATGAAQAVFLPQVATETGWTLDEFLGRLCLKAGLERDAYRHSPAMKFFTVSRPRCSAKERPRK